MSELPAAFGDAPCLGRLKTAPEDFIVHEQMHVSPEGEGEHLWLHIEKRGWNTEDVAVWLAKQAKIHRLAVGYSGLKDKHAVTRQWFSLHLPGKADPDFDWPEGVTLLDARRHRRKLNRGTHRSNGFQLLVRDVSGDQAALAERLVQIAGRGVPNYFGTQRFGRGGKNVERGRAWLAGGEAPRKRSLRSIWLSAVRSDLFNRVLAERVTRHCWDRVIGGDLLQPDGSRGLFLADDDPEAAARVSEGEVHPTAPMPGVTSMASSGACLALEQQVLADHTQIVDGLAREGVDEVRRATRLPVRSLDWSLEGGRLELVFTLPTGAFATTVMAELIRHL